MVSSRAFTGEPGIQVALPDDPTPSDIYNLIVTDELLRSWKTETNRCARTVISSKDHNFCRIGAASKPGDLLF
ncbi:hypothetical protein PoB_003103100 [Plakobranchus ocellatus]|uniref:Uncharacterized protein n=1 Tax=Plakobranchus ocellatus TaxID=259542 RepID=A0AAV3ZZW8_9GAST|nr:hypothetical protein PoB_003103100 [Plakobranchus ocellatus]